MRNKIHRKTAARLIGGPVLLAVGLCLFSYAEEAKDSSKKDAAAPTASPYTNSVPVSVFHEMEGRDPFLPVGYKKPKPMDPGQNIDVDLVISGTSFSEDGAPLATTKDGLFLEVGGTYTYRAKDGKASVTYKVLSISDDGVVISYNDKEKTFKLESSDLEKFKEKEESP
jgi:hypothetical protein